MLVFTLEMLDARWWYKLNEDYVLYLRASGVKSITLMLHVLRNAIQVAVSIFCMSIPMIMGGA